EYAHVPMILAPDRSKLSKRHGATSVEQFRQEGYLPEALVNYMALLGWAPEGDEIFSLPEAIAQFTLDRVNKTAAVYDMPKLTWMNGHYLREGELKRIVSSAEPFYRQEGLISEELDSQGRQYLRQVVEIVRDREKTLLEVARASTYFYQDSFTYDQKGANKFFRKEGTSGILRSAAAKILSLTDFDAAAIARAYNELAKSLELPVGRLMPLSRLAVSGRTMGPELFDIMAVLGPKRVAYRLQRTADYIDTHFS
ncbi:MAG TPA: glutamate--tRNA ligase, partial [Firmicutes bacterium]|nr:glutamate--tRNA ligase [Bacillota bacterium]